MRKPELTAYEKALNERYGPDFAELLRNQKKKTRDYPCGCENKGDEQWQVCAEHADLLLQALEDNEP